MCIGLFVVVYMCLEVVFIFIWVGLVFDYRNVGGFVFVFMEILGRVVVILLNKVRLVGFFLELFCCFYLGRLLYLYCYYYFFVWERSWGEG